MTGTMINSDLLFHFEARWPCEKQTFTGLVRRDVEWSEWHAELIHLCPSPPEGGATVRTRISDRLVSIDSALWARGGQIPTWT